MKNKTGRKIPAFYVFRSRKLFGRTQIGRNTFQIDLVNVKKLALNLSIIHTNQYNRCLGMHQPQFSLLKRIKKIK
jgi:hypothetical protein